MKDPTYVETFPFTDELLISEFTQDFNSLPPIPTPLVPHPSSRIHTKVWRVAGYVYQRVTGRKIVPFQPSPEKNPKYLLAYVVETLECGHKVTVHPIDGEPFTARKRSCHECSGLFVKKPAGKDKQAQRSRSTGKSIWPAIGFAFGCFCLVGALCYNAEHKASGHLRVLHNVRTLARLDDYNFRFQVTDPYSNQDVEFGLTACKTFKPTAEIQRGVTLTLLQFVQHDDNSCVDFTLLSNGYTLLRGKNNEPVKSDAGPSTGASVQGPTTETTSTAPGTGKERTVRVDELQQPRKGN